MSCFPNGHRKRLQCTQNQTQAPISEEIIGDTIVVVCVIENGDLKKIVDDLKNANEKTLARLYDAKGGLLMEQLLKETNSEINLSFLLNDYHGLLLLQLSNDTGNYHYKLIRD